MSVIGTGSVCANASGVSMPGHPDDDRSAGAEPVAGVELGRVDVDVVGVGRHRRLLQVEPQPGRSGRVRAGVEVVRIGEQALLARSRDRIAAIGGVDLDADRVAAVALRGIALPPGPVGNGDLLRLAGGAAGLPLLRLVGDGGVDVGAETAAEQRLRFVADGEAGGQGLALLQLQLLRLGDPGLVAALLERDAQLRLQRPLRLDLDLELAAVGQRRLRRRQQRDLRLPGLAVLGSRGRTGDREGQHEGRATQQATARLIEAALIKASPPWSNTPLPARVR